MSTEQERAAFEAWATDNGEYPKAVERDSAGNYRLMKVHTDWIAWQAARAAPAAAPVRELCAAAYQVVGAADGPVEMLDNLLAVADGKPLPHAPGAGLPWHSAMPVQAVPDGWSVYVAGMIGGYLGWGVDDERIQAVAGIIERRRWAAPAAPQVPAVPQAELLTAISDVAAAFVGVNMKCHPPQEFAMDLLAGAIGRLRNAATALAAAPQPAERVPLTDEQLLALLGDIDADTKRLPPGIKAFARAVEQAHGIRAAGVKEPGNAGHQGREASPA